MKTAGFETIVYTLDAPLARIMMNRPDKHNAISLPMLRELRAAILLAEHDDSVNVLLLTAAGNRTFSAGIDLAGGIMDKPATITKTMLHDVLPLLECMEQSRKLIIACVEGTAIGFGCSLALQCDLMMMSENASLNLSFSKLGLIADGGLNWQLPQKVGFNRALQMVLEAQVLDAERCQQLGIANKVVAAQDMQQEVNSWARELAGRSSLVPAHSKQLMRDAMKGSGLLQTVREEARIQAICADSNFFKKAFAGVLGR